MDGVGIGGLGAYLEQSGMHLPYAVGINGTSKVWTLDTLERRRVDFRSSSAADLADPADGCTAHVEQRNAQHRPCASVGQALEANFHRKERVARIGDGDNAAKLRRERLGHLPIDR